MRQIKINSLKPLDARGRFSDLMLELGVSFVVQGESIALEVMLLSVVIYCVLELVVVEMRLSVG
jgi:hypothetical protein